MTTQDKKVFQFGTIETPAESKELIQYFSWNDYDVMTLPMH